MTTYAPKPGDYVVTADLPRDAIAIFLADMLKAGAREGTPLERAKERTYFGWDLRDNTVYACDNLRVGSRTLFHNNVTDYYRRVHAVASTTARNPFQTGDRVVPNGFKARDDEHFFSTNGIMCQWETERTVLTIQDTPEPERVSASDDRGWTYSYHPAELRMATAEEISTADALADAPKAPEQPPLAKGMVLKAKDADTVMIVTDPAPDGDGDIRVTKLGRPVGTFFRPTRGYTVLGQVMPNGDYRPTESIRGAIDPSQWERGQKVRCITALPFLTRGNVYTLQSGATTNAAGTVRINIIDDDGDPTTRDANQFEAV